MKFFLKNLLLIPLILLLISMGISAQSSSVTLQKNHEIRGPHITLGDLFEINDPNLSKTMIDKNLLPGKSKRYTENTLSILAIQYQIPWQKSNSDDSVLITRKQYSLTNQKLQEILKPRAAEASGDTLVSLKFDKHDYGIHLPDQKDLQFEIKEFNYDPIHKKFVSKMMIANLQEIDQSLKGPYYISGQISNMIEIPVLIKPMRGGDLISEREIDFIEITSKKLNAQMILNADDLIGKTPRRLIKSFTPIRDRDVLEPIIVKKHALVRMIYDDGNIHIIAKGKAKQKGAKGDVIDVINTSSKRVIQATITNQNEVRVQSNTDNGS